MAFMEYEIVRGPFMLLETVAMVYKYVKGSSFVEAMSRQRFFLDNVTFAAQSKKMARLQEIMEEVCAGLDLKDPLWSPIQILPFAYPPLQFQISSTDIRPL